MTRLPSFSAFQANAFTWNFALGMTNLLVPLYAHDLGMSGVSIGSLIALPMLVQIGFNLLGGAYADRLGAKPGDTVRIVRAKNRGKRGSRGERAVDLLRGTGSGKMTTDEILRLMRGD